MMQPSIRIGQENGGVALSTVVEGLVSLDKAGLGIQHS